MTTQTNPIDELIRTALADLQPRIEISKTNIDTLTYQRDVENRTHADLLAQDAAYRAALPKDEPDTDAEADA